MPTEPQPPTLAEVARRAVEICDARGEDPILGDFYARFEDRDEPITAVPDIDAVVSEERMRVDPEGDDPAAAVAGAVIVYLAHRRDEVADVPEDIIRLAARSEWNGSPPPAVEDWLARQGFET